MFKSFFLKNFENAQKNIMKSANFFVFVLYCTKRRCSEIKPQLKVEIKDGREAPKDSSSLLNFYIFVQNMKSDL